MTDLPQPLATPECDCTDLDGFMLNVERLMASELVALSTHEVIAAALLIWCRAWKQRPAASLPDDDRVIAAFAKLPLPRFKKHKEDILRGFVKCADGRLYHKVLAVEAMRAYERKLSFQKKREADAKRLREWRQSRDETHGETRFVQEGQGQGQGQNEKEGSDPRGSGAAAPLPASVDMPGKPAKPAKHDPWKAIYDRGKEVLGKDSGGLITKLKKIYDDKPSKVMAKIEDAAEHRDPLEWLTAFLWKVNDGGKLSGEYIGGVPP